MFIQYKKMMTDKKKVTMHAIQSQMKVDDYAFGSFTYRINLHFAGPNSPVTFPFTESQFVTA